MTVQVDSQPVTDQIMWYIDICRFDHSISYLEKKTTKGSHDQKCYTTVCLSIKIINYQNMTEGN